MRISKMLTCVIAALVLMYGSGCSDQMAGITRYQMVPGYGYVPAGAVVNPNTGFVTNPQTYAATAPVYDQAVTYAATPPVSAPVTAQTVYVKAGKAKQRRKVSYNRWNARFANVAAQPAPQGYYVANPDYGTAALLSNPDIVPSVTTAPAYAGPAYTDPAVVTPVATGPVVTVTKYAPTSGAKRIAQVAGANCGTAYRRGRRVKAVKAPRPAGYVPYTVITPATTYAVPYTGVYTVPTVVCPEPRPAATYMPQPLPVEPEPAPAAPAAVSPPMVEKPAEKPAEPAAEKAAESVVVVAEKEESKPAEPAAQQPIVQPIVIQPIIQPIIQMPAQQYAETAAVQVQAPAPVPVQAPMPMQVPIMPLPPMQQEPIVSEPLPGVMPVPGVAGSGFEPGILGSYCPPEICPVPNAVVCAPGQNLSECFTMNDYQLQNTPVQVFRPEMNAPLSFPAAGAMAASQPTAAQPQLVEAGKYQALTPPAIAAAPAQPMRPNIAPPEVSMPAPIGGTTMPPVPATAEIESALDAMLSRDARTPNLK